MELKAKALSLIWCFVEVIKVDTYGDSVKSSIVYILIYHVTMQINKIPQLAMGLQTIKRWGHGSIRDRVAIESTLEPIGCDQMLMGKPMYP